MKNKSSMLEEGFWFMILLPLSTRVAWKLDLVFNANMTSCYSCHLGLYVFNDMMWVRVANKSPWFLCTNFGSAIKLHSFRTSSAYWI